MKIAILPALVTIIGLSLASLSANGEQGQTSDVAPQAAAAQPTRIIAAGGVVTEIVYALGRSDALVGVDTTSTYPETALKEKPNVGYVRALSSEGLLSLKPTTLVAVESAGPRDVLKTVEEAGIKIVTVPEVATPAGISTKVREISDLLGEKEKGAALADDIDKKFVAIDALRAQIKKPRRALFILSFMNGRAMVGGRNTSADGILKLAGLENVASVLEGWKPISDEALFEAAPDVIVAMAHGPQDTTVDSIMAVPAFAATPAAKSKSILIFDGGYLLSFGPRTPTAARDLILAAYPELAKPDKRSDLQ
jgi:iron complex transport system substrate-binding protein